MHRHGDGQPGDGQPGDDQPGDDRSDPGGDAGAGPPSEPEVGAASLWLLRTATVLTVVIVIWFLIDAIEG